jgi:ribosomal protein L29
MKTYKMADLLKKDVKALNEDMAKLKADLSQLKVKAGFRKNNEDTSGASKIKKQIARIQTALNHPQAEVKEVKKETTKETKKELKK